MDKRKNDYYYFAKIREDLLFITRHMRDTEIEDLARNELLQDSMMFRLIQISENARKMSDAFQTDHEEIPWMAMYGLRNRLVHDYGNVDLNVVYETLKKDIPELLDLLTEADLV